MDYGSLVLSSATIIWLGQENADCHEVDQGVRNKKMSINHGNDGCNCVICSGEMTRKTLTKHEEKLMERFGWFAHVVVADPNIATGYNYHTHGMNVTLGHLDLQIVLPLSEKKCHSIAATIYDQVHSGMKFDDGDETKIPRSNGSNYPVRFIKVREGDREVLRVILPSAEGKLEPKDVADDDEPEYALQWTVEAV